MLDFDQLPIKMGEIRAVIENFETVRKLPIDDQVRPTFTPDMSWFDKFSDEEKLTKGNYMQQRFMMGMASFWNMELLRDKSERHMPLDVHYERIVRRMQKTLMN